MNFQWLLGKSVAKNMVSYSRLEQNPDNDPDDSEDNNNENDKLSTLPHSKAGSLSSIITTSIASSEPDPDRGESVGRDPEKRDDRTSAVIKQEKWWQITLQVSIPFFIAGIGTIGAGIILGRVTHWKVFAHVKELYILIPSLSGLKGNLDMCLASRLSTQANLGNMKTPKDVIHMVVGNIALVQVQATVASLLAALFAVSAGSIINGPVNFETFLLLVASSMFTAATSCFVLDFVLVAVILSSHRFKMNPDNLATPLAASIGDVVSLSLLSLLASMLYENLHTHLWITYVIVAGYFLLLPLWILVVYNNRYTKTVLTSGWTPVLSALFISGISGLVFDAAQEVYQGMAVFLPIINGIGGNLVSVQASKISTMLHQSSIIGIIPPYTKIVETPWRALIKGVPYAQTARILILMSIPGQVCFIIIAEYVQMGTTDANIAVDFILTYLTVSTIQVMALLYIAHIMVHSMWKWKLDPDNSAIPYLTALGDVLGSSLLALAFLFLTKIGSEYVTSQEPV